MDALWEALADPELAPALFAPRSALRASRLRRIALAAAAAVLIGVILSTWWLATRPDVYRTAVGEVTSFQLSDRSVVFMNAASELSVRYSDDARLVELRSGEAAFDVAKDEQRPFVVETGTSRVVVLGTKFVVRRTTGGTAVTVIEGQVRVESAIDLVPPPETERSLEAPPPAPSRTVQLAARQRLTLDVNGAAQLTTLAPDDQPAAWRQRRLVFSSARLEEVAAEFNRFNADPIRIEDPNLMNLRIGGVFDANDPGSLLAFLEDLDGVEVLTADDGTVIVSRAE